MVEPLYQVDVSCPFCLSNFKSSKVRPSFKKAVGTDTDFFVRYREPNPDYYVVRVCPTCGYAASENFSDKLTDAQRRVFEERVKSNWTMRKYGGERNWETAMQTYKLALLCAQIKEEKDRVVAGLLHHIAWLYREREDRDQEERFLGFALDAYVRVYEMEGMDLNNARLMFLLGELNRRLKHYNDAVKWFARIINDKKIMDAGMIRASREQWAVTREDMLAAQMELPEEMNAEEESKSKKKN